MQKVSAPVIARYLAPILVYSLLIVFYIVGSLKVYGLYEPISLMSYLAKLSGSGLFMVLTLWSYYKVTTASMYCLLNREIFYKIDLF
jgi:hypothetical protein